MDIKRSWWELTNCGTTFIENTVAHLEKNESMVWHCEDKLPWTDHLFKKLRGANVSSSKSFEIISGAKINNPGEYIFNNYCSPEVQSAYWPSPPEYTHVNFLAETDNIIINQRYIFVRDIESEKTFLQWFNFVDKYLDCVEKSKNSESKRAVFILEYSGKRLNRSSRKISTVKFNLREVDIYTYNLVNTAPEYENYLLNQYAAELIAQIGNGDVERCGLISKATDLIYDPQNAVTRLKNEYPELRRIYDKHIQDSVQLAQIKIFFPIIEQKRREFIGKYYNNILSVLPWRNDYGENRTEPFEMELRDLLFKASVIKISFEDKKAIEEIKQKRNRLAHNHVLSYEDILYFIGL